MTKKYPFPIFDGESLAIHNLSEALVAAGAQVTLLAMNTHRHPGAIADKAPEHYQAIHTVAVDNRIKPIAALVNLFSDSSYHIERFISSAFAQKLHQLLEVETYDIIQLETLYLAPYIELIRTWSKAPVIMRAHNVEHEIWERVLHNTSPGPKRWYLSHLTKKLSRYESDKLNDYDLLLPISERDAYLFKKMGYTGRMKYVPIGVDKDKYTPDYTPCDGDWHVSFIGSLDWTPNIEGLKWFLQEVWPSVHDQLPALYFHIAGRNAPAWLEHARYPNVVVHGEVPDAAEFLNAYPLLVTPLRSGSGMRAKILEGMVLGRVIITTTLGKEGIPAEHGRHLLVADSAEDFIRCFTYCHRKRNQLIDIGKRARAFVADNFDSYAIGAELMETYRTFKPVKVP